MARKRKARKPRRPESLPVLSSSTGVESGDTQTRSVGVAGADAATSDVDQTRPEPAVVQARFPRLSRIRPARMFLLWLEVDGYLHAAALLAVALMFLGFGLHHLGQFFTVDETFWLYDRVPKVYAALAAGDWGQTYVNDKIGLLPSLLAGLANLRLDHRDFPPAIFEHYLFWWRLPVLLFNFLTLFPIYFFTRRLFDRHTALLTTALIALNPVLIGMSQIVNPDATLWPLAYLTFVSFLLYTKTGSMRYIVCSGLFLALSLLSKYVTPVFYLYFPVVLYADYLFRNRDRRGVLCGFLALVGLTLISIAVFTATMPATWVRHELILKGTVYVSQLRKAWPPFLVMLGVILFELFILKGRVSEYLRTRLHIQAMSILLLNGVIVGLFVYFAVNIVFFYDTFDLSDIFVRKRRGEFSLAFLKGLLGFFQISSISNLIGMVLFVAATSIAVKRRSIEPDYGIIFYCMMFILVYIAGSAFGGIVASRRYSIILYPISALITGFFATRLLRPVRVPVAIGFLVLLSVAETAYFRPFYFYYTNPLNFRHAGNSNWGFGGYELAQMANRLPNAENLKVISDYPGFNRFFVGKSYWLDQKATPRLLRYFDYVYLSASGEARVLKTLRRRDPERIVMTDALRAYYNRPGEFSLTVGRNPNNYVKLVKVRK